MGAVLAIQFLPVFEGCGAYLVFVYLNLAVSTLACLLAVIFWYGWLGITGLLVLFVTLLTEPFCSRDIDTS